MPPPLSEYVTIRSAAEMVGRRRETVWRWATAGDVRLQTWMVGGRRMTTERALREFIAETTARADRDRDRDGDEPDDTDTTTTSDTDATLREAGIR